MSSYLTDRAAVRKQVKTCRGCELGKKAEERDREPVPFRGDLPCDVLVVGEAPDKMDEGNGQPFVGKAGRLLDKVIADVGWDGLSVSFANTVSCYPVGRAPTQGEVRACRGNLSAQIDVLRPRVLVLLGGIAVSAWWPEVRVGAVRGRWWETITDEDVARKVTFGVPTIATWHPAAVMRNRALLSEMRADLLRVEVVLKGTWPTTPKNTSCIVCGGKGEERSSENVKGLSWCDDHWKEREMKGKGKGKGKAVNVVAPRRRKVVEADVQGTLL